jgi:hypothetical protein
MSTEMEILKKKVKEMLEIKNTTTIEMKDGLTCRLDTYEERISELEDVPIEMS